ncbi:phage portal family protein [Spirosoma aerophilum]
MIQVSAPKAKRVTVKKSTIKGTLTFGANNLLPQDLLTLVSDSVTARACLATRAQFIQGNGFTDPAIAKMVVHRSGLTLDQVLHRTSNNVAYFEGVVLHIGYNGHGKIASIRPIPYEFIRLCEPDDMGIITHAAICPYLDGGYNANKKNLFTKIPLFNPDPAVVQAQMVEAGGIEQYQGQLLYEPFWAPGDGYYHQPSWMTAVRAIESEGQLDLFNWNTIVNGFNVSGILSVIGDSTKTAANYDPLLDPQSIEYQLADNQGAENAARVMVMRFKTESEAQATKFLDITGANLAQRFEYTSGWAADMITRAMNVPNELVGIRRNGGIAPTGDEVIVASQLMYQTVNPYQRRITELFAFIFANWQTPMPGADFHIENLNYFPDSPNGSTATVAQSG